jgi:hypothetical protein
MTIEAQNLLHSFDTLQEIDKMEVAAEIIRRSLTLDMPPLSDEQLCAAADDIFLEMDKEESHDAKS